jgi:DUF4097 and DUF4098 domain-containing protein YvlB
MNEERAMILKMLREGKISVEEADALLDVLNDEQEEPGGFAAKREASETNRATLEGMEPGREEAADGTRGERSRSEQDHGNRDRKRGDAGGEGVKFGFDLDLSGLTEGLRSAMASVKESMGGVSEALKDAFRDVGDVEIHSDRGFFGKIRTEMGKARAQEDRELSFDVGDQTELHITNPWGDVRITASDAHRITGTAELACWGPDSEHAQEMLESTRIGFEEREGAIVFVIESQAEKRLRVDLDLRVPAELAPTVALSTGDLWLEGMVGGCAVNSLSGDIQVANVGREESTEHLFSTKSGDVSASALIGSVGLSVASGDISVSGYQGSLAVTTQSGDIQIEDGRGSLQAKSISGNIDVTLEEIEEGEVKVTSVSGSVELALPRGAHLDLTASSLSGSVDIDLETDVHDQSGRRFNGSMNGGGLPVSVNTVSGDVEIEEN